MRTVRISMFAFLAACSTSAAWAQYGLYGSPETLRLPQQDMTQYNAAPANYPTTATPTAQPAPAQAYALPQQQYRYPSQSPTTAMYQPYQAGAQYRYPGPYSRPPVRTASVDQPGAIAPIPAPPGPYAAPNAYSAPNSVTPLPQAGGFPMAPNQGVTSQMLAEQNGYGGDGSCSSGVYRGAVGQYERSACGQYTEGCGDGMCGQCCYCPWYASASALVLGRSDSRRLWTTYEDGNLPNQLMNSQFSMPWKWGGELRVGRRFCCGCTPYAVEAVFWTTDALTGSQSATVNGGYVSTTLDVNDIHIRDAGGTNWPATHWFTGAEEQTLSRRDEFQNFEINLVREQLAWACDSPWDIGWSVGVRYFRLQEDLNFCSLEQGGSWNNPGEYGYLRDTVNNNLFGVQFGFDAAYNVCNCVRLFITPKVGIYNNAIDGTFQARLGNGTKAVSDYYGAFNDPRATLNAISFLTQIDVGADWQITRNWSARAGYRVVAITGLALADDQFPQYITDIPEWQHVQNNGSLVLQGAFFGVTYNF